jgi:hypothetical protein
MRRPATLLLLVLPVALWTLIPNSVGSTPAGASSSSTTTTTTTAAQQSTTTTTTAPTSKTAANDAKATHWVLKAIQDEAAVGSVHVNGTIKQGKSTIKLNLVVNGDGEGGGLFVQEGNPIQIKRVGPILYFNAPRKFWAAHASKAQTKAFGGRWLEFSALDSRFESFDQFLDASDLVTAAFQGHSTPLTVSKPTTYQGHKVVVVKDVVKSKGKTSTGLMDIAATGKAYVYRIVDNTPGEVGTILFSHYGKAVSISVPPNAINLT